MKFKKSLSLCIVSLILAVGTYQIIFNPDKDAFDAKNIHRLLFDLYFPATDSITIFQKVKRLFYKEFIWYKIKDHPKIQENLNHVLDARHTLSADLHQFITSQLKFETLFPNGHNGDALRQELLKKAPPAVRKELFKLRQTWLYIIYSIPLAYEIAGIEQPKAPPLYAISLDLPPSKLNLSASEIVHKDGEIDYLIIGSGPAGSLIAHELTRTISNVRVVLVESGSFVKPLSTITEFSADLMESENGRRSDTGSVIIRNGATVGGGTTVNLDLAFSPQLSQIKEKLSLWVKNGNLANSFLHNQKDDWGKLIEAENWVKAHVGTRAVQEDEINTNNRILMNGHPFAKTYELNALKPTGKPGEILKRSATEAFIVPALLQSASFKGNLSLIPDVKVERILFFQTQNDKHATGALVKFHTPLDKPYVLSDPNHFNPDYTREYQIKAKNIILCAGALGSAEILLRSDIENPNIGKGIVIHPSMGILGLFPQEVNVHNGLSASVYAPSPDGSYFFESMAADPTFIALIHPGNGQEILKTIRNYKHLGGFGAMLIDNPQGSNFIYLDKQTNQVQVHYEFGDYEKEKLRTALKQGATILFEQGAHDVFIPTAENIYKNELFKPFASKKEAFAAIDNLQFLDALNFISSAHMQGSNKLGKNPECSVVSLNFKVWNFNEKKEISNLYVCDSSIFPTSVGANPMQSIYSIAKIFVDQHIAQTQK